MAHLGWGECHTQGYQRSSARTPPKGERSPSSRNERMVLCVELLGAAGALAAVHTGLGQQLCAVVITCVSRGRAGPARSLAARNRACWASWADA
eukprot:9401021-Pyramimonas_sp.AAC.1